MKSGKIASPLSSTNPRKNLLSRSVNQLTSQVTKPYRSAEEFTSILPTAPWLEPSLPLRVV